MIDGKDGCRPNEGWNCPKCQRAHAPWVVTCPEGATPLPTTTYLTINSGAVSASTARQITEIANRAVRVAQNRN